MINQKPLVSCIIIFFNAGEEFFIEAIKSIFAQTYDNWELLLADDGSTNESTAIALRYAQQNLEKVHYVEHQGHQNRGMSATRNLGIRHAKGKYIAFLDADDIWLPHKLEQQVSILESHPEAAMLYGRTQFWFSWTEQNPVSSWNPVGDGQKDFMTTTSIQFDTLIKPPTQLLLLLQFREIYPCTCSILIRRQVFEDIGGFEEDFRNALEDMVFHSKLFLRLPVYVSSECWDKYRIHPDSYWRRADRQGKGEETHYAARLKYLNWLENYLSKQKIKDPLLWFALKKALLLYRHPTLYGLSIRIKKLKPQIIGLGRKTARGILPTPLRMRLGDSMRSLVLQNSIKHIFGLKRIDSSDNNLIVLCVVKNGESSIKSFIENYFSSGAKHIVFLDNDSTDRTVAIASKYSNVTILKTNHKGAKYRTVMEKYLIQRFARNKPHLVAKLDETTL
jgi:glycosyltransferase involved in cell wall biosynthesis